MPDITSITSQRLHISLQFNLIYLLVTIYNHSINMERAGHQNADTRLQSTTRESDPPGYSIVTLLSLHSFIFALIGVLGFCLQLKFPDASAFATAYGTVMMDLFIIHTCFYIVSLVVMGIMAASNNTDFEDLMNKISLLLGSLSLILELLVLISPFGWIALSFWSIFLSKSCRSLNTLYQSAVAHLVQDYQTLKDLIIRNDGRMTGHEAQNQNHTTELRLPV